MSTADRRTVLKGAAATCGLGRLAACGGGSQDAGAPAPSPSGGASLGQLSDIPVGGAISADAPGGTKLLLARPAENEVVAFSAVCPHQGCTVAPDDQQFTCPCHGSQFELSGDLKRGPAERGLTPFAVELVDGQVLTA